MMILLIYLSFKPNPELKGPVALRLACAGYRSTLWANDIRAHTSRWREPKRARAWITVISACKPVTATGIRPITRATGGLGSATRCRGRTGGWTGGRTTPNPPH